MDYSELVEVYCNLESNPSRLEKTRIIAELLTKTPRKDLGIVPILIMGRIFPDGSPQELGVGTGILYETILFATGMNEGKFNKLIKEEGDVGEATKKSFILKKQTVLSTEILTIRKVSDNFEKIARISGKRAQSRKIKLLSELLSNATPLEAKYLIRTILGELRAGVAEGIVKDAIAKSFDIVPSVVERAYMITNDLGKVAIIAMEEGEKGLKQLNVVVGVPLKAMLAQICPSIEDGLKGINKAILEIKYDGARIQIHKKGDKIKIYSRRLEDVTRALPDIVELTKKAVTSRDAIIEGEAVAVDSITHKPKAFQDLLRRFRRKYSVKKMTEEIPFETYVFDILFVDGETLIDFPFEERRRLLETIINPISKKFEIANQLITKDPFEAESFYQNALEVGHEGVMIKNKDAPYIPGKRVGTMYKIKPIMETLDLVVTGAKWGTGKRTGWMSSYMLATKDSKSGQFLSIGRVGTGVTDQQLEEFTLKLKPLIVGEEGIIVKIKPEFVVEVAFQEIQKSTKYNSGYALRFPRVVRARYDKSQLDADDMAKVSSLYKLQKMNS
tara:strand:+ start:4878 stop:6551 length:1674 start_codon:yes stop_codon:yes gene_type:complete